jgi:hypothetical protein
MKMLETGKTDLLDKFWSQRTRRPSAPSSALKEDGSTGFEFAPRAPKDPNAPPRLEAQGRGRKAPSRSPRPKLPRRIGKPSRPRCV